MQETYKARVTVVKDCTGTYVRHQGQDYKVCNDEVLESYKNKSAVELNFSDVNPCKVEENVATCMMYHAFIGSVIIDSIAN